MNDLARLARFTGFLALVFLLAACSAERKEEDVKETIAPGDPVLAVTRVDNGVTVFEYPGDALAKAPQWTLDSTPTATFGGEGESRYDLTRVSYVAPLSDGRVMTFAKVGNQVFVFGRDGKGERVIGRTGQGPGDWMRFGDPVLLESDTVLVLDFANNRLNWVTADGGIVRMSPYEITSDMRRMSSISGFIETGDLILHSAGTWGSHEQDSLNRSIAKVLASNLANSQVRPLITLPDLQAAPFETRFRGRIRNDLHPLRLGGQAHVTGWDSVIATATTSSPGVTLWDQNGIQRGRLILPATRRAVSQRMRDGRIAQELGWLTGSSSEGLVDAGESQRIAREAPFADSLPYFERLFTASDRTLWVVDAMAPADSGWSATGITKDGSIFARLVVSQDSRPMAFGAGQVIVRSEDDNGVVTLRLYRFIKRSAHGQ